MPARLSALLLGGALILSTTLALAVSPHFVTARATVGPDGALVIAWKEAGLGQNVLIDYTASATAQATYVCVNGGGKHPQAANKETLTEPVSQSGSFASGKNGNVVGELVVDPPGPGTFACPPGQRLQLACVVYSDLALSDDTNGISLSLGGPVRFHDPVAGQFCGV